MTSWAERELAKMEQDRRKTGLGRLGVDLGNSGRSLGAGLYLGDAGILLGAHLIR
jgi:hypothetical protein